jgi:ATP-dependent Lon protease
MIRKSRAKKSVAQKTVSQASLYTLPLLPLKNVVMLPKSIIPIVVGRASSIEAVEAALKHDNAIFITAQKNAETENPGLNDIFETGIRATILQVMRMPKGAIKILVEGLCRSTITHLENSVPFLEVSCIDVPTENLEDTIELEALWRHLKELYADFVRTNTKAPADLIAGAKTSTDMDMLSDTLAVHMNLSFDERQSLLESADLNERIVKLCQLMKKEIEILETEERIRGRVQTQVEKSQKEYYLHEQMKAIQKELGRDDQYAEIAAIRQKIKTLGMSAEAAEKAEKELRRLEQMPPLSAEAAVSRSYIDWLISLPWQKKSKDTISLEAAEKILNKKHASLKKAKERIIEFLAAKKFSESLTRSPIICLAGPPGVGKTSLAHSIADSLGREFVRISLGGVKDESEIRGHRRTYIGALPGKIIQAIKKAKTINPVILLDEIDKMSNSYHGDPAAALLEVLDPEQNKTFVDHYIEAEYDLSNVMFVTTANHIEGIPYALYDRMEIITLSGYTEDEKKNICKEFLLPKLLKEYGLKAKQFKLSDTLLEKIICQYTKEAGVRQIERVLAKLMRKTIQLLLKDTSVTSVTLDEALVKEWLGHAHYKKTTLNQTTDRIGLATGLAWTEMGGDVLEIEASVVAGKGGMTLTGQLGEVMQESAHAALSYIRSKADELGLPASFPSNKDIHVHIPEGATPKDGPSAGITMCTALVSALTKNSIKPDLAMTGELTLRGRVLGVGGLKEKILAARQHGIKTVLLPQENYDDVFDVKKELGTDVELVFVRTMDEVLEKALTKNPFTQKKAVTKTKRTTKKKALTRTKAIKEKKA